MKTNDCITRTFLKNIFLIALAISSLFTGCKKEEEPDPVNPAVTDYSTGIFIINEGNYSQGNASLTYFNRDSKIIIEDLFEEINSRPLGDVVQSMAVYENKGYIVVNNSQKVEVVNMTDLKSIGIIDSLTSPRYCIGVNSDKVYISDWFDNNIKVVSTSSFNVSKTISTGQGPEQMLLVNNTLYVANSGGFGVDSSITIIDTQTDMVSGSITVGVNPVSLELDANGALWVLCKGDYNGTYTDPNDDYHAELIKINTTSNTIEKRFMVGSLGDHPSKLAISKNKDILYFENFGVYRFNIADTALSSNTFISKSFYGLGVDPQTDYIYGSDPLDYQQKGYVFRYDNNASLIDSFKVGIIPGGFLFN